MPSPSTPPRKATRFPTARPRRSSGSVIAFIDAPEGYEIELIQYREMIRRTRRKLETTLTAHGL